MIAKTVLLLVILGTSSAILFDEFVQRKWDDLKVRWGPKVDDPNVFLSMPRTAKDAVDQGFKKISDCDENPKWRGARYVQDDDYMIVLMYDVNGYIAGLQTMVPTEQGATYGVTPPFIKDGDNYFLTSYFVNPATICSKGRSAEEFTAQGTGRELFVQNGTTADAQNLVRIPVQESDIAGTEWVKGKCVPTMGGHYWHDPTENMDCDFLNPIVPLYNDQQLAGLEWVIATDITSKWRDHKYTGPGPTNPEMIPVTKCLKSYKVYSTLHFYFTSDIAGVRIC